MTLSCALSLHSLAPSPFTLLLDTASNEVAFETGSELVVCTVQIWVTEVREREERKEGTRGGGEW